MRVLFFLRRNYEKESILHRACLYSGLAGDCMGYSMYGARGFRRFHGSCTGIYSAFDDIRISAVLQLWHGGIHIASNYLVLNDDHPSKGEAIIFLLSQSFYMVLCWMVRLRWLFLSL